MSKCLVTKLKAVVDNDELPIFNAVKLRIYSNTEDYQRKLSKCVGATVEVPSGQTFSNGIFSDGDYTALIKDKDNLTELGITPGGQQSKIGINISEIAHCTKLSYVGLDSYNAVGDIANLSNLTLLTYIECYSSRIYGNIASLKNLSLLKNLYVQGLTGIYGDIGETFSNMLSFSGTFLTGSKVTGTLESVVTNQCANGRISGTISIDTNGLITCNSIACTEDASYTITYSSTGATISKSGSVVATYTKSTHSWVYA